MKAKLRRTEGKRHYVQVNCKMSSLFDDHKESSLTAYKLSDSFVMIQRNQEKKWFNKIYKIL